MLDVLSKRFKGIDLTTSPNKAREEEAEKTCLSTDVVDRHARSDKLL